MAIDPKLPIPVYFQLKTLLLEEILEGRYGLDGRLPTEHELCARHGISRTPVTRARREVAAEGVVTRHRRRGTFVNPHWVHRHRGGPELRVIVPEGPWEGLIRRAAPVGTRLSVATVELHELHQALTHAVAEGLGPDLAVLDSVWVPEFTAAGFLAPLEELDEHWVAGEYEHDFLAPLLLAGCTLGRTFAVHAEADVAGLWYRRAPPGGPGRGPPAARAGSGWWPTSGTGRSACSPTARGRSASAAATRAPASPRRPACCCRSCGTTSGSPRSPAAPGGRRRRWPAAWCTASSGRRPTRSWRWGCGRRRPGQRRWRECPAPPARYRRGAPPSPRSRATRRCWPRPRSSSSTRPCGPPPRPTRACPRS